MRIYRNSEYPILHSRRIDLVQEYRKTANLHCPLLSQIHSKRYPSPIVPDPLPDPILDPVLYPFPDPVSDPFPYPVPYPNTGHVPDPIQ